MTNNPQAHSSFPIGERKTGNFTGEVYFKILFNEDTPLNGPVANVTFAPGGKTKWHAHDVGQVILVTDGKGYYQEEGGPVLELNQGDVVRFEKGVKHWHGAREDSWMSHLAMTPGQTEWFEAVEE